MATLVQLLFFFSTQHDSCITGLFELKKRLDVVFCQAVSTYSTCMHALNCELHTVHIILWSVCIIEPVGGYLSYTILCICVCMQCAHNYGYVH